MRFSLLTIWMDIKLKLLVSGLVFAISFTLGLIQQSLGRTFWPGSYTLSGLLFFLGLGVLLGLNGPDLWRKSSSAIKPFVTNRPTHPYRLSRAIMAGLTLIVFATTLGGGFIAHWLMREALVLPENFLLSPLAWKAILFCLPAISAVGLGIAFGLILDLSFALMFLIDLPEYQHAKRYRIHNAIRNLLAIIFISFSLGWPTGFYLASSQPERWLAFILIPLLICLVILLISLLENPKYMSSETEFETNVLFKKVTPELACRPSKIASLVTVVLAGFSVWEIIHWKFALTNWPGASHIFSDQLTLLQIILLVILAAAAGIRLGPKLISKSRKSFLTTLDYQGLSLALLGIVNMLMIAIANTTMKASLISTYTPFSVLPLLFICLGFLWGLSVSFAIGGVAIGRPNRFDLWLEIIRKLTVGSLLFGPLYLCWQNLSLPLGNLLALSAGSLVAIAVGGIALIYDSPIGIDRRESRSGKIIHAVSVFVLYLALVFILMTVPSLKKGWFRTINTANAIIIEGNGGVASITSSSNPCLTWAGQFKFPERSDPHIRMQCHELLMEMIAKKQKSFFLPLRLLLVNLPYLDDVNLSKFSSQAVTQVDVDRALRDSEKLFNCFEPSVYSADLDFSEFAGSNGHYNLIITLLRSNSEKSMVWPELLILVDRLISQASSPDVLRFMMFVSDRRNDNAILKIGRLKKLLQQRTNIDFILTTRQMDSDHCWLILSPR